MNTFQQKIIGAAALVGVIALTACNSPSHSESLNISDISGSDSVSEHSESLNASVTSGFNSVSDESRESSESGNSEVVTPEISDEDDMEVDYEINMNYEFSLPVIPADETLQMTKLDLPELIEGHLYNVHLLLDEKTFVVSLLGNGGNEESGLYNVETKEYRAMPGLPSQGYRAYNGDYIVYVDYDGNFVDSKSNDDSVKLFLYDLKAQKSTLIYTYSFDRGVEVFGGHWRESILLMDGKVYFDDYKKEEGDSWHATIYTYDIATGTLETLKDNAENPMIYKDTIVYVDQGSDTLKLASLNGKYEADLGHSNISFFTPMKERLLTFRSIFDDKRLISTHEIRDAFTNECFLTTERTISNPEYGDTFMAFRDFLNDYTPIVYSAALNSFISFDDLAGKDVYWHFSGETGYVCTLTHNTDETPEAYVFKLK